MLRRAAWSANSPTVARRSSAQIFSNGMRSDSKLAESIIMLHADMAHSNEIGGNASRQPSVDSSEHSPHPSPMTVPVSLSMVPAHTIAAVPYSQQPAMSPLPEPSTLSRYNPAQFRTPQHPRTPRAVPANTSSHFLQSSPIFKTSPT